MIEVNWGDGLRIKETASEVFSQDLNYECLGPATLFCWQATLSWGSPEKGPPTF